VPPGPRRATGETDPRPSFQEGEMRRAPIIAVGMLFALSGTVAGAVTTNVSTPITQSVYVACANGGAGELVVLEGSLHTLITYTVNDQNVSGKYHFQPQGVIGTGSITGATYHATGVTQESFTMSLQNGQETRTYVNNFRIIGPGPGNNFLVHNLVHMTLNAAGDLTASVDQFSAECK
jgi:hypothetical protein